MTVKYVLNNLFSTFPLHTFTLIHLNREYVWKYVCVNYHLYSEALNSINWFQMFLALRQRQTKKEFPKKHRNNFVSKAKNII